MFLFLHFSLVLLVRRDRIAVHRIIFGLPKLIAASLDVQLMLASLVELFDHHLA